MSEKATAHMSDLSERIAKLSPEKRAALAKRLQSSPEAARPLAPEPIAIIGMSCRFPDADGPDAFWQMLMNRVDAVTEVPGDRWDADRLFDADTTAAGKIATRWGGFLNRVDEFDAHFFGISPREAVRMDPQQRLLLEIAWEAFEDAGRTVEQLAGSQTGVFIGLQSQSADYFWLQFDDLSQMDAFTGPGTAHNIASGRLSYVFDLQGPNLVVDTACSSSLVAVHLACQSLRASECSMAVAGGVNLMLSPLWNVPLSRMQILASDGRCKTFDAKADGMVRSEGCGAVVLKRLSDAVADRDRILAVIRGSAVNQDGRTNGITAPNGLSQRALVRQALRNAGVAAAEISHVETHGTGTPLGDPIEVEALAEIIGEPRADAGTCYLGAVKTNIGHLEGAAGIAGLIKVILSLRHETIPPLAHFTTLNPHISLEGTRFVIPTAASAWASSSGRRLAGISSFGWSGTNAHMIVEQAPANAVDRDDENAGDARAHVLPISARSAPALVALAERYRDFLRSAAPDSRLDDVCYTASLRRSHHEHRAAVVGSSRHEIADALDALASGQPRRGTSAGQLRPGRNASTVFVFCGQGPQWRGMGRELLRDEPVFRDAVGRCDAEIRQIAGWSPLDELLADGDRSRLDQTEFAQPLLFTLQVGLAALWSSWGVTPSAVVGHSVGEIAAAHVAGALTLADASRIVVHRARIMQQATGLGKMAVVELPVREVERAVAAFAGRISIAAVNAPTSTVVSGEPSAVDELLGALKERQVLVQAIPVNYAFHSYQMAPSAKELTAALAGLSPAALRVPMFSTVTGRACSGPELDASYWGRNVGERVRFADAINGLASGDDKAFLEIGPHPVLTSAISQCLGERTPHTVAYSLQRNNPERASMLSALGGLYAAGCSVDWTPLFGASARCVQLPAYPWQRERYWISRVRGKSLDEQLSGRVSASQTDAAADGAEHRLNDWFYSIDWSAAPARELVASSQVAASGGTWVVFADRDGLGLRLAARLESRGDKAVLVFPSHDQSRTTTGALSVDADDPEDFNRLWTTLTREATSPLRGIVHLWSLDSTSPATTSSLESDQRRNCGSVLHFVKAMIAARSSSSSRLLLVTRGAQAVTDADAVAVAQAPLWGLARALKLELSEIRCDRLDLDPSAESDDIDVLLRELPDTAEDQVAYRGATRYVARLRRLPPAVATDSAADRRLQTPLPAGALNPDATYLITGGLGALGLHVARWLVDRGARSLVLASRTGEAAAAAMPALDQLKAAGANIVVARADVSRREDVQRLLAEIAASQAPLRGIVHAAGVLDDGVLIQQNFARFARVMAPKIAGSWNLHSLTLDLPLDFFILFSSASAVLGSPGQTNYAAANAFLDALAHLRRAQGLPALSINWGAWSVSGMAAALDERDQRRWAERGLVAMSPADAVAALQALAGAGFPQVAVLPMDWRRYCEQFPGGAAPAFLSLVVQDHTAAAETLPRSAAARLRAELESAAPRKRLDLLMNHVRIHAMSVLGLPPTFSLDAQQGLRDVGLDSLLALELRNRLQSAVESPLPATLAFYFPTVADLARHLAQNVLRLELTAPSDGPASDESARQTALDEIDELSDEMAEALLNAELSGVRGDRGERN